MGQMQENSKNAIHLLASKLPHGWPQDLGQCLVRSESKQNSYEESRSRMQIDTTAFSGSSFDATDWVNVALRDGKTQNTSIEVRIIMRRCVISHFL